MIERNRKLIAACAGLVGLIAFGAAVVVAIGRLPWRAGDAPSPETSPDAANRYPPQKYSPSELVPASVPLPSNIRFSTAQSAIMPYDNRNFVDRMVAAHDLSRTLPNGVVVVSRAPNEFKDLVETYRQAVAQAEDKEPVLSPGLALTILAGGPLLLQNQTAHIKQ